MAVLTSCVTVSPLAAPSVVASPCAALSKSFDRWHGRPVNRLLRAGDFEDLEESVRDCKFVSGGEFVMAKLDLVSYARSHSHKFTALADFVQSFERDTPSLLQWFNACVPHPCVQDPIQLRWVLWREWRRRNLGGLHGLNFSQAFPAPWPADFTVRLEGGPPDGSCFTEPYSFKPCCFLNAHYCWLTPYGKMYSFENCCVFRRFDGQDKMLPFLAASEITVEVFGRPILLRQEGVQQYWSPGNAPSLSSLSPKMLWQGSYALARWLEDAADLPCSTLRGPGVRMVELGTGMGLGAIAARLLGVPHVTAIDADKRAIALARINAEAALGKAGMAGLEFLQMDWGNVTAQARSGVLPPGLQPGTADVVIGGTVGFHLESSSFETLLRLLKPSGVVLFAERWQEINLELVKPFFEVETVANAHERRYVAAVNGKSPMRLYRLRPKRE